MPSKRTTFPYRITRDSVTVTIYQNRKKGGHLAFLITYRQNGRRIQESKSDFEAARRRAETVAQDIADGMVGATKLSTDDRQTLLRAYDLLEGQGITLPVDAVCREFLEAHTILQGRASLSEACRYFINQHAVEDPKVSVSEAKDALLEQARADHKSERRIAQLAGVLSRFAESMSCELACLTPQLVSRYLSALPFAERTKRNHRDVLHYFSRWCVMRGYLAKDADLLRGVQHYSSRKHGEIQIYTPRELSKLLGAAEDALVPFLAISAFAGLRHAEVARLDWSEIDLEEGYVEVKASKSKVKVRRLVPISANLKAWLILHIKAQGRVCLFSNIPKQLAKCAAEAGVQWKHNGLRHSAISYRIAECADVPRVADESGTSLAVIKSNYLRRVKPTQASAWFQIVPGPMESGAAPPGPDKSCRAAA